MKSPIKWIGGKREDIKYFEKYIPKFETYVEPFFGGGALFWHLKPEKAIINDINPNLVNFYKMLIENTEKINGFLNTYINNKDFYYQVVKQLNNKQYKNDVEQAAMFYYLNKTAHSGQWRENSKGMYNTSYGYYKKDFYKNIDTCYGKILNNVEIFNNDFIDIFEMVQNDNNTFVFLDPPYLDCDTLYTANQKFEDIYKYIIYYLLYSKCKVMLVVKSTNYLEKLFKSYIIDRYEKRYRNNAKSNNENQHIVITNY